MKRTIYKCDRCGKEAETKEEIEKMQLGELKLGFDLSYGSMTSTPHIYAPHVMWQQDWCLKCREEVGVVRKLVIDASRAGEPVVTLETVIREMIQQEMENR